MASKSGDEISSFIDQSSIEAEKKYLVSSLKEVLGLFKQINSLEISLKGTGNAKEATKAIKDYSDQLIKAEKLESQIAITREKVAKAIIAEERAQRLLNDAKKESASIPYTNNLATLEKERAQLEKTGTVVNDLDKKQAAAAISAAEYGKSVNSAATSTRLAAKEDIELVKARAALIKANSQQNVQLQGLTLQKSLANKAAKEEASLALGLLSPYQLLEKQYRETALNAKDLAVEFGRNSKEAKVAAAEALQLNAKLQAIDKTVGQSQRNVGNYTNGIQKAFSGLRSLANLIPGIGIGGVFLIAIDPIIRLTKYITEASAAEKDLAEKNKLLSDTYSLANKNASENITNLKILYDGTQNVSLATKDRIKAAKALQETYPETFKNFTAEQILLGQAKTAYDDLTTSILKNALATAAKSKLAELSNQELDVYQKYADGRTKIKKQIDNLNITKTDAQLAADFNLTTPNQIERFKANAKIEQQARKDDLKANTDNYVNALISIREKQKTLIDFVGAENLINAVIGNPKKSGAGSADNQIQALKERIETAFDIYKVGQTRKIKNFEEDLKSDSIHYLEKLKILDEYIQAQEELRKKQEANDIAQKILEGQREVQRLQEEKKGKTAEQKRRIDENIVIVQQNVEDAILLIKTIASDKSIDIFNDASDKRKKILDDYLKYEKEIEEQVAKNEQDALDAANKRFAAGIKKREEQEKAAAEKSIELNKELNDKKVQLALSAENLLFSLGQDSFTRALNGIKDQKDAIDEQTRKKLEANDALVQSEQQKAANIEIINQRAQNQKDVLDKKAREIQNQQAKFQRAQQLFEIAIQTIKSVALIKSNAAAIASNPLYPPGVGAALAAKALLQIPFVIASGALAAGALAASALPKFKSGKTKDNPFTGWAIKNDGGKIEPTLKADGSIHISSGAPKDTLTYVEKGDTIFPSVKDMINELFLPKIMSAGNAMDNKSQAIDISEIVRAVHGINITTQIVTERGHEYRNNKLSDYNEWVEKYIKN